MIKTEIAWSAGLFDGEGTVFLTHESRPRKDGTRRRYPRLQVGNTDKGLLDRFQRALDGAGKTYGPYQPSGNRKLVWRWVAEGAKALSAARTLFRYVSHRNRIRIRKAFSL